MPIRIVPPTASAYRYPLLIKQLLLTPLSIAPEQEISYQGRSSYTYRGLRERIGRLANALAALGVEAGDTVAVMDWDSHRYLENFFAVPMMGAILQTVNVRLSAEQILYTLNHAQPKVLLVNREFLPLVDSIRDRFASVRSLVLLADGEDLALPPGYAGEYETLLAAAAPDYEFPDFDENAQATTFYTTGTTGDPKGVCFSHRQIVLHALGVATALGGTRDHARLHREDVYMPLTPMFHVHAWGFPYIATMLGLRQVYPGKYLPDNLLRLLREHKVTFSHCVPSILQMLFSHPHAEGMDFNGWKIVIGGSAMSPTLARAALQRGVDVFTGYGMSETCPVLTLALLDSTDLQKPVDEQAVLRCKTGLPLPLVDIRVADADVKPLPHDGSSTGEVVVRSPWLTPCYMGKPEESEQLWRGGYLHTQDIGHIDARGYLKITDRLKDVIKTAGEWTSSLQIEDVVAKHEAVHEVAVIGVPDEKWGERPLALVVLKPDYEGKVTEHALRNFAAHLIESSGISRHGVLLQVNFVKALSKTSVGKINKREMREARLQGA